MSEPSPTPPVEPTPDLSLTTPEPTPTPTPSPTPPKASIINEPDPAPKPEEPKGAPEAYAEYKLPEGVSLNAETITKANELFKGLGLTQEAAQSLIDFHVAQTQAAATAADDTYRQTVEAWGAQLKADPEIGGKLPEVRAALGKAYDVLIEAAGPKAAEARALVNEFKSVMDLTGAGNHPAFVKLFHRLAQRVIEPGHVSGTGPSPLGQGARGGNPGIAASMYPPKTS